MPQLAGLTHLRVFILKPVHMEACSFACSYVPMEGGLVQFSYEHVIFLWEFHKEGVISPK